MYDLKIKDMNKNNEDELLEWLRKEFKNDEIVQQKLENVNEMFIMYLNKCQMLDDVNKEDLHILKMQLYEFISIVQNMWELNYLLAEHAMINAIKLKKNHE